MSGRLILIEGPTGAGKSTLAEKLVKKYKLPYVHRCAPPTRIKDPRLVEEWFRDTFLLRGSPGMILDRWAYSNRVYGKALKNQIILPPSALLRLEQNALELFDRCDTIFLSASPESLLRRIHRRSKHTWDRLQNVRTLKALCQGYDREFNHCSLSKVQLTTVDAAATYRSAHAFLEGSTNS